MDNECTYSYDNGTYPHELGHFFGLYHTHQDTQFGNSDPDAENVARTGPQSNCLIAGDLLCDTDADPRYTSGFFNQSTCSYTGTQADEYGVTYTPPVDNIMSYYPDACGGIFTSDQYAAISSGLVQRLGYGTYDVDGCQPPNVTDPSNVVATYNIVSNSVVVTWTDNSNNEEGFLIERSVNGSEFRAIVGGGVAENVTSYSDPTIESNVSYQYRIRASNDLGTNNALSQSITTPLVYCNPTSGSGNCTVAGIGLGINGVTITGGTTPLNNNPNGCQQDYTNYTNMSTEAAPGDQLSFSVNLVTSGNNYFEQNVSWWIDKDQNGDFDGAGELLFQSNFTSGQGTSVKTGSFIIPNDATPGLTTLRVRTRYYDHGPVTDPCGYVSYSEAEDYGISIISNCVSNVSNAVSSELEDAIACVPFGGTVHLMGSLANSTIDLGSQPLQFNKDVIIEANPSDNISITCGGSNPGIQINSGFNVELRGFTFTHHSSSVPSINNQGDLILQNMIIENNSGQQVYNQNGSTLIIEGNCQLAK